MEKSVSHWAPSPEQISELDRLYSDYRFQVNSFFRPFVLQYDSALLGADEAAYLKMVELSTKMTLVGHACTLLTGFPFDERRRNIRHLYGGCCFLADGFIDDFGPERARDYLARLEILLSHGRFEAQTPRERLFYIILANLFAERNVLSPMLRQAICLLFMAQQQDVQLRFETRKLMAQSKAQRLQTLKVCAGHRSGHAINVLTRFLVPQFPLAYVRALYAAGALIMHIDDHGDCYADLHHGRITYMNQLKRPAERLRIIFIQVMRRIEADLPANAGRDLLQAFLYRYYATRIKKHHLEKRRIGERWTVYE